MAGRGPAPKDPAKRARGNRDPIGTTTLRAEGTVKAPALPARDPFGLPFPEATKKWWSTWKAAPQAETFSSTDWSFLLDTAVLHAALWRGDTKAAPELRLRVAKFGATLEDRARLRMVFAQADITEAKGKRATAGARERYGKGLTVVEGGKAAGSAK